AEQATRADWCCITLPGPDAPPTPFPARLRGSVSLKDVLLDRDRQPPPGTSIKIWYAMLLFVGATHQAGQQVIRPHLGAWVVKLPNRRETAAQTRAIGLTRLADQGACGIDDLPGEVFLAADPNLPLFPAGEPLPEDFGSE